MTRDYPNHAFEIYTLIIYGEEIVMEIGVWVGVLTQYYSLITLKWHLKWNASTMEMKLISNGGIIT